MVDVALSLAEIEAQFPEQWVLVEDPRTNAALEVAGGTVRWHGKDRDEAYRKAAELRPRRFAMLFTGSVPEGMEIVI